ncbi:hypothetical protein QE408_003673 [Agrobacterium larrymoorei]|uniref:Uncharacterized protein n=1 Tax=Agrobacterium larrymoorei TaxID=160699 RepID=A0ABU0UNJ0_9HYPH|nr:hypothetical protein [Agrobacterium larrymoorei]
MPLFLFDVRDGGRIPPSVLPDISPSRGEISKKKRPPLIRNFRDDRAVAPPDLPLEGEMSGRTEGGAAANAKHADSPRPTQATVSTSFAASTGT